MYKFNDDTLIHSAGVNFCTIESIMKNGIVSLKYGNDHNISVNRNYFGSNLDDTISCVRYLYVNDAVEDSAYSKYVKKGISFIMEDVPFIHDKNERVIHRSDEVLVEDFIPKEKIKAISIPSKLMDSTFEELEYIKEDSTSYANIKHIADTISDYIKKEGGLNRDYNDFYRELYYLNNEFIGASLTEKKEIREEFRECIKELNYEIGIDYKDFFKKVIGRDDVTILDALNYINNKTLKLPIYEIEARNMGKGTR